MRETATRSAFECISITHIWKHSERLAIAEILPIGSRFIPPSACFSLRSGRTSGLGRQGQHVLKTGEPLNGCYSPMNELNSQ